MFYFIRRFQFSPKIDASYFKNPTKFLELALSDNDQDLLHNYLTLSQRIRYKILLKTDLGRKLLNKILKKPLNFYLPNIILSSVSLEKTSKILQNTSIILYVPHHNQSGLTIRTFEEIGLNKKLITTNENVKNYDFYNSNNIFIVNKGNLHLLDNFIRLPYIKLSDAIYKKYSVTNWVKSFFLEENISYFN
jgi:hypothetical protein